MRKIFGILALSLFSLTALNAETSEDTYRSIRPNPTQTLPSYQYMTGISNTEFRAIGGVALVETFSITKSGSYQFVQDIKYTGRSDRVVTVEGGACSIFINADDVVIDLGNFTLYDNTGATTTGSTGKGIDIASGKKNIVIKNGNIIGYPDTGIYVREGVDNLRIQNVTISQCWKQGIYMLGVTDANSSDRNMITNGIIENCVIGRSTGTLTTDAYGLRVTEGFNILVNQCVFNRNDTGTLAADAYGARITSCTNVVFTNCDASGNRGDDAYGFRVDASSVACGFYDCNAHGNWGEHATANGIGYGFSANTVNACTWENCAANGNQGSVMGNGFHFNTARYCQLTGCSSYYSKSGSKGNGAGEGARGFYSTTGEGNIWEDCMSVGAQCDLNLAAAEAMGFDLQSETYSMIKGCTSRNNGDNDTNPWGIGIHLQGTTQCIVDNCKMMHNKSDTTEQGIGLLDTKPTSNTLVTNCFFFNNGEGSTAQNFHIAYASPGELNVTATVDQGDMVGLADIKPYQNTNIAMVAA
jgi:hypothetical protein